MNQYKAIIFDYGGVIHLVPESNGKGIFEYLCENLELDIEEFKAIYFANNYRNNLEDWTHKDTLLYAVEKLTSEKEDQEVLKVKADGLIEDFLRRRTINVDLLNVIKSIKNSGYTVALLSNYNSALRVAIAENGVAEIFDTNVFISTEIGYQKPDSRIFEHTFNTLGVTPGEVIFIDDSPMSLSTAKDIGYHPIQFIDNDQLFKDLHKLNITW